MDHKLYTVLVGLCAAPEEAVERVGDVDADVCTLRQPLLLYASVDVPPTLDADYHVLFDDSVRCISDFRLLILSRQQHTGGETPGGSFIY